ncbi:MAG: hypothetical protein ACLQHF_17615 [Terracidiphilus sp.]
MKNITVSVSDKAYAAARTWAAVNCTSVSAAVQAYIEMLPKTKTTPENLEFINRVRQQARARDRAAKNEAATQIPQSPASKPSAASVFSALRSFLQKHAGTVQ